MELKKEAETSRTTSLDSPEMDLEPNDVTDNSRLFLNPDTEFSSFFKNNNDIEEDLNHINPAIAEGKTSIVDMLYEMVEDADKKSDILKDAMIENNINSQTVMEEKSDPEWFPDQ